MRHFHDDEKAVNHFEKTPGFFAGAEAELLYAVAAEASEFGVGVEIGSLYGKSAGVIAAAMPGQSVFCIDPWEWLPKDFGEFLKYMRPIPGEIKDAYETFIYNVAKFSNIVALRGKSEEMVGLIRGPVGLVHIDGDHSEAACAQDIALAKSLGARYVALHDYNEPAFGVTEAANKNLPGSPSRVAGHLAVWKL